MPDAFDRFLASALSVPERQVDRGFVTRVQTRIAIDDLLAAQRRSIVSGLFKQLAVLAAIAVPVWRLAQSPAIAGWLSESPSTALATLLASFGLLVVVLTFPLGDHVRLTRLM